MILPLGVGDRDINIDVKLTVHTPEEGTQITGLRIESLDVGNLSAHIAFDWVVRRLLERLCTDGSDKTIVILVDPAPHPPPGRAPPAP